MQVNSGHKLTNCKNVKIANCKTCKDCKKFTTPQNRKKLQICKNTRPAKNAEVAKQQKLQTAELRNCKKIQIANRKNDQCNCYMDTNCVKNLVQLKQEWAT